MRGRYGARVIGVLSPDRRPPVRGRLRSLAPETWVLAASGGLIALLVVLHVGNRATIDSDLLRLDLEANVPTWASSLLFGLAGLACLGVSATRRRGRRLWAGVGALALALSLDETAALHERLSADIGSTSAEWIVQPLVGLAAIALLLAAGRQAGGPAQRLLLAAAGALVLGHLAELATPAPEEGALAAALKIVEESFEMLVAAFVLAAAAARAAREDLLMRLS
jgi:hypothetical protein